MMGIYMCMKSSSHSSPLGAFCVIGSSSAATRDLSASAPNIKFHNPTPNPVPPPLAFAPPPLPSFPLAPLPLALTPPVLLLPVYMTIENMKIDNNVMQSKL